MAAKKHGEQPAVTSVLEWISAAVGLALAIAMFGIIGWQALHGNEEAVPQLEASASKFSATANGYVVEVEVRNGSDATAAAVAVQGELRRGGTSVETAQATIDYVPARSKRSAGLIFSKDPRQFELRVRPVGYERP